MFNYKYLTQEIFSYSIVLLPFLYQYAGIGETISFGEVVSIIMTGLVIITLDCTKLRIDKTLLTFYLVTLFSLLANIFCIHFDIGSSITLVMRLFTYAVIIVISRKYFKINIVLRFYIYFSFLLSVYVYIQFLYYYFYGGYLPILINENLVFPPEQRAVLENLYMYMFRPSSFFLEPSYFAFFVLPAISILLFTREKSIKVWTYFATIVGALLVSTAASGILGTLLICGKYCFSKFNTKNVIKQATAIMTVSLIIFIVAFLLIINDGSVIVARLREGGSIGERVFRGFLVFSQYDIYSMIFGVGLNNVDSYVTTNGIYTIFDESNLNYGASIPQTLMFSGIFGELALLLFLYNKWRNMNTIINKLGNQKTVLYPDVLKAMFITMLYQLMYESTLFSYRFAFILILIEGLEKIFDNKYKEKIKYFL